MHLHLRLANDHRPFALGTSWTEQLEYGWNEEVNGHDDDNEREGHEKHHT